MKKLSIAFFSAVILFTLAAFIETTAEDLSSETGFVDAVDTLMQ